MRRLVVLILCLCCMLVFDSYAAKCSHNNYTTEYVSITKHKCKCRVCGSVWTTNHDAGDNPVRKESLRFSGKHCYTCVDCGHEFAPELHSFIAKRLKGDKHRLDCVDCRYVRMQSCRLDDKFEDGVCGYCGQHGWFKADDAVCRICPFRFPNGVNPPSTQFYREILNCYDQFEVFDRVGTRSFRNNWISRGINTDGYFVDFEYVFNNEDSRNAYVYFDYGNSDYMEWHYHYHIGVPHFVKMFLRDHYRDGIRVVFNCDGVDRFIDDGDGGFVVAVYDESQWSQGFWAYEYDGSGSRTGSSLTWTTFSGMHSQQESGYQSNGSEHWKV